MACSGPVEDTIIMRQQERIKNLEEAVASLSAQNESLREENGRLTKRLRECGKNIQEDICVEETVDDSNGNMSPLFLPSTVRTVDQPKGGGSLESQPENSIEDTATIFSGSTAVEEKARKKKKRTFSENMVNVLDDQKTDAAANDMSHYATRHVALKLMYLGFRYHGFASQAALQRTVESELFTAFHRTRLISGTAAEAKYSRCGRTDKGVSAVGQVIALYLRSKQNAHQLEKCASVGNDENLLFESFIACGVSEAENTGDAKLTAPTMDATISDRDRVAIARASRSKEAFLASTASDHDEFDYVGMLNRALPEDIRVMGWCPVPPGFNARFSCLYREYKYFFIDNGLNIDAMKVACKGFEGDHNFTNFCKMDAANVHNYMRTITAFDILPLNEMWGGKRVWIMRVKGTAFLWHQVRCMAAVLFMVGSGYELPTIVEEMLDVEKYVRKPQYIMAPETPLLLFHCGFQGLSFHCHPDSVKRLRLHLDSLLEESVLSSSLILQGLLELPSSGMGSLDTIHLDGPELKKSTHVPLLKRPTEPTYEERRNLQCASKSEMKEQIDDLTCS